MKDYRIEIFVLTETDGEEESHSVETFKIDELAEALEYMDNYDFEQGETEIHADIWFDDEPIYELTQV